MKSVWIITVRATPTTLYWGKGEWHRSIFDADHYETVGDAIKSDHPLWLNDRRTFVENVYVRDEEEQKQYDHEQKLGQNRFEFK